MCPIPANTGRLTNIVLMLAHFLRRWSNIKTNSNIFRHLKLETALAIPASNDEKYNNIEAIQQDKGWGWNVKCKGIRIMMNDTRHQTQWWYPSKHDALTQWWFNAGPASQTMDQRWASNG